MARQTRTAGPAPKASASSAATAVQSRKLIRSRDTAVFVVVVFALIVFGFVMAYSSAFTTAIDWDTTITAMMRNQILSIVLGVAIAVALWRFVPMRFLAGNFAYVLWIIGFLLNVLTILIGTEEYGATRWLDLSFIKVQPSEIMKIILIIAAAKILSDYRQGVLPLKQTLIMFLVAMGLPLGVILIGQSDFGTTLICAIGILAVMLLGGVSWKLIVPILGVGVVGAVIAVFGTSYRMDRVNVWLDPWIDPYGDGYQMIHSYYALAEGGFFGVGLGQSHEKFQYLPFAYNDFIFAVIGEELGMVGCLFVVLLFFALLVAGLRIAFSCESDFCKMVAGATVIVVVAEAFLNICCVTGLLPVTGKPLPFFSMGGTVLLTTIASMGLVLAASRDSDANDLYVKRRENLRLVTTKR